MRSFASLAIGAALLYWPYLWCWVRKENIEIYGLRWDFDPVAIFHTLLITAFVLILLTPVALLWPWDTLPHHRSLTAVLNMIASGLAAAIIEETFFRGWLQTMLRKKMSAVIAICIVNLIFAPIHLIASPSLISLATFFPGLIMGALKERYNNVLPSIMFHFLGNIWAIWFFPAPF
jgi:membrane protease YdiL (CAAX protease family)